MAILSAGFDTETYILLKGESAGGRLPILNNDDRIRLDVPDDWSSCENVDIDVGSSRYIACDGSEVTFQGHSFTLSREERNKIKYYLKVTKEETLNDKLYSYHSANHRTTLLSAILSLTLHYYSHVLLQTEATNTRLAYPILVCFFHIISSLDSLTHAYSVALPFYNLVCYCFVTTVFIFQWKSKTEFFRVEPCATDKVGSLRSLLPHGLVL